MYRYYIPSLIIFMEKKILYYEKYNIWIYFILCGNTVKCKKIDPEYRYQTYTSTSISYRLKNSQNHYPITENERTLSIFANFSTKQRYSMSSDKLEK